MKTLIRSKNFYKWLVMDAVMVMVSYYLAYLMRFEGAIPGCEWLEIKASISWALRLYRGMWRYTSFVNLFNFFKATAISSGGIYLFIIFINRFHGVDLQIIQSCY